LEHGLIPGTPLIVAALPAELAGVQRRLVRDGAGPSASAAGVHLDWGLIRGRPVAVGSTGDGPYRARRIEALLEAVRPRRTLVVGLAGGLDPALATGSMVRVRQVLDGEGGVRFLLHGTGRPVAAGVVDGCVRSSTTIVDTARAKATLWAKLGRPPACVVDLESETYAAALDQREVPTTILRVVSDDAQEDLPPMIAESVDRDGSVRPLRVAAAAVWRPAHWGALVRLGTRLQRAAERLGQEAEHWLGSEA
jgi:nucleoside phosphorylase